MLYQGSLFYFSWIIVFLPQLLINVLSIYEDLQVFWDCFCHRWSRQTMIKQVQGSHSTTKKAALFCCLLYYLKFRCSCNGIYWSQHKGWKLNFTEANTLAQEVQGWDFNFMIFHRILVSTCVSHPKFCSITAVQQEGFHIPCPHTALQETPPSHCACCFVLAGGCTCTFLDPDKRSYWLRK